MESFLEEIVARVERDPRGVAERADISLKRVKKFLADPTEVRISTFSRISRAVDLSCGEIHLLDQRTGKCITCAQPADAHQPLLPEGVLMFIVYTYEPGADPLCHAYNGSADGGPFSEESATAYSQKWKTLHPEGTVMVLAIEIGPALDA